MVSDPLLTDPGVNRVVSIRFEVRGGFRQATGHPPRVGRLVSIRFEVRGGFRLFAITLGAVLATFQSALRFAVVSDPTP